ncbi:MAG TPA: Urease accessory protein UreE [Alphaproteobacteria bacterium]|nr:Urease accessory protein UreE [Alphaproteobacteria bacterium]
MLHAHRIAPAGHWPSEECRGTVTLGYDDRHRRRLRLATDAGEPVLLDLPYTAVLADGDGLALSEGGFVAVRAALEDLVEITADTPALLSRIAWHVGNRHVPAELDGQRILIREDHVIVAMVEGLGGTVRHIQAPFTPEGGAYAAHAHGSELDSDHV